MKEEYICEICLMVIEDTNNMTRTTNEPHLYWHNSCYSNKYGEKEFLSLFGGEDEWNTH